MRNTSWNSGSGMRSETETRRMTIGLTWRRTARRIKRLKEAVLTISPAYSIARPPTFWCSSINQVVSRRFVKKQQMQWTLRGAHLLLQTRTKVLNADLDDLFRRWYPKFRPQPQTQEPERKAA